MCHAGDTSQNLLWRLKNGEAPEGLSPDAVVILVGTNDLAKSFITKVSPVSQLSLAVRYAHAGFRFCTSRQAWLDNITFIHFHRSTSSRVQDSTGIFKSWSTLFIALYVSMPILQEILPSRSFML